MAIRFEYPAAAGLIGAYAAGQGARQARQQKYALDMIERNKDRQFKYQMMQPQLALGADRNRMLQQRVNQDWAKDMQWVPNPNQPAPLTPQQRVTNRKRARKGLPPWYPEKPGGKWERRPPQQQPVPPLLHAPLPGEQPNAQPGDPVANIIRPPQQPQGNILADNGLATPEDEANDLVSYYLEALYA